MPYVRLLNMTPHDAYIITIHVRKITIADIIHKQGSKILLSNKQDSKANNAIVKICQNLYVWFK